MRRPKRVKIGPFVFTIEFNESAVTRAAKDREDEGPYYGVTSFEKLLIAISPSLTPIEREVLMHEVLHGICSVSGLGAKLKGDEEETIVSAISPYLLDTLRENKTVTRFLLED